ncbi:MAG: hypothetical protein ACRDPT_12440, partial [Streptomycetales bacterium]
ARRWRGTGRAAGSTPRGYVGSPGTCRANPRVGVPAGESAGLDKRSDVDRYVETADRVVVASATPEESVEMIRTIRDELTE